MTGQITSIWTTIAASRLQRLQALWQTLVTQSGLTAAVLLFCLSGCHFTPPKPSTLWKWKKEEPTVVPEKLLAVWSDSVLHQPGMPGVRGFGGRIYFYQTEASEPVKVDGALAVYVFDADELDPYNQKPLRKFAFTADQFKDHFSGSTLGPSYSVWLPWDEVGGQARRLSLIARFEGREGGTVISDPVIKLLPGLTKSSTADKQGASESTGNPIRMVGHQEHKSEPVVPPELLKRRDIQTIELPPSFKKHLKFDAVQEPASGPVTLSEPQVSPAALVPSGSVFPQATGAGSSSGNADTILAVETPIVTPAASKNMSGAPGSTRPWGPEAKRDIRRGIPLEPPR